MAFKLAGAQVGGRGQKLPEGRFRVAIQKITAKTSVNKKAKTQGDDYSIVEFIVKEVYSQKAVNAKKPKDGNLVIGEVAVGARRSWSMNMKNDAAAGNLVAFCAACLGLDPHDDPALKEVAEGNEEFWDETYEELSGETNPMLDKELIVETSLVETQDGWPFMVHEWTPVPAAEQAA
jgi:hypothetical protein